MNKLKNFVKLLLSIKAVRKIYDFIMRGIASIGSSNRVTSTLYNGIFFLPFNREQYAVLRGRRDYYKNLKKDRRTHTELRRNVHRLEKGILMQPRRDIFARDYIAETVEFYERAVKQCKDNPASIDENELQWAHNVLAEYFEVVKTGDKGVDQARQKFEALLELYNPAGKDKKPYKNSERVTSTVSYDELLKLSQQRRSVRWFVKKKVPRELIDKALLVGRQSPTACNRLPYEFKIYDDPKLVKKVASIPFGAAGYSHNIPTIIVVVGKLESYFSPRDRHVIYVDASLAAMPFMFALETLGLSSSVINWPDFEPLERKMQKTIGLSVDERPIFLIAVGYPDPNGMVAYSEKKSLETLRTYNKMGSDE